MPCSCEMKIGDQHVDQLDSDEWSDETPEAVNQDILRKYYGGAGGAAVYSAQRERNQENDDDGVEDDRGQNRGLRPSEVHDVQNAEHGKRTGEHSGDDREI